MEEADGAQLRPQARKLLCSLELVRTVLREQSLSQPNSYPEPVRAVLVQFDQLFAEFELRWEPGLGLWGRGGYGRARGSSWSPCLSSYVSSMVVVKSPEEIYRQQEIIVLFCETVGR